MTFEPPPPPPPIPPPPSQPPRPDVGGFGARDEPLFPAATWHWWEAILVYIVSQIVVLAPLLILDLLGVIDLRDVDSGPTFVATLYCGEIAFLVTTLFWTRVVHRTPIRVLGVPEEPLKDVAIGVPVGVGLFVAGIVVSIAVGIAYNAVTGHQPPSPDQVPTAVHGVWLALTGFGVIVLAPLGEETLFRGFLYGGFRRFWPMVPAAVASGALFGLGHLQGIEFWVLITPLWVVGIGLAILYEKRRSLVASMAAHATFNVIGFLFLLLDRR
jgi:membrane protease YdiL (CAAX protease family)